MGETVDALGYKADVPSRAKESISETAQSIKDKIGGTGSRMSQAAPDAQDVKHAGRQAVGMVQENPLGLAVGAAAAGFLLGLLLPSSRMEDERIGGAADAVKSKAAEAGQEALSRGQQVAQEVAQTASQTAREAGSQHATELTDTARQKASEAADEARSRAQ
jgi:ElaB/YqjD/DUF883 family membrane-anchored ribosome-binding protein